MQKCVLGLAFFVFHVPSKKAFGDFVHIASCFFRSTFHPGPQRLQTAKKVPSSRHVRMDGTHTGKLSAESVRAALRRVRGSALNFVPRGIPGGRNFCPAQQAEMGSPWSVSLVRHAEAAGAFSPPAAVPVLCLFQIVPQPSGPAGVAQLTQRFGFDLPHPLPGDVELLPQLLQSAGPAVLQPEPQG